VILMEFFTSAIDTLETLVIALGAGLAVWGVINLLEGYGNDNPGAKSQGIKQLMAGGGVALIGMVLVPLLSDLFSVLPRGVIWENRLALRSGSRNCSFRASPRISPECLTN
jgi:hypothetical protein